MKNLLQLSIILAVSALSISSCSGDGDAIEYRNPTVNELTKHKAFAMANKSKTRTYTIGFGEDTFSAYRTNSTTIDDYGIFKYTISGSKISFCEKYNEDRKYEATMKLYNQIENYPNLVIEGSNLPTCMSAGDYVSF